MTSILPRSALLSLLLFAGASLSTAALADVPPEPCSGKQAGDACTTMSNQPGTCTVNQAGGLSCTPAAPTTTSSGAGGSSGSGEGGSGEGEDDDDGCSMAAGGPAAGGAALALPLLLAAALAARRRRRAC